ncbi:MAG: bacteriohemerythrin [candidate division Zixibacteria bacterium]|nr:bacteriohemerythrin [candidate division Zixibacteria bacterium]
MSFMIWSDHLYSIKVPEIDAQHRRLLELINELHDEIGAGRGNEDIGRFLAAIVEYVRFHFAEEERIMKESSYPGLESHRQMHVDLVNQIVAMLRKLKKGTPISSFQLLSFLKQWWDGHICEDDKRLGAYLTRKTAAPAGC